MVEIKSQDDFLNLTENQFIGTIPQLKNSQIRFEGTGNVLVCEEGVTLCDTKINFHGNNSIVYLCANCHEYKLNINTYHNSVFYIGKDNYINGALNVILSEEKHVFIGSGGLFSFGIWMRNADPHLIYDVDTKKRLNNTKSIFIGDHVWVGQSALLLKGTQLYSGSILAAGAVISSKKVMSNTCWGGNPAKELKTDIFWDGACVHAWTKKQAKEKSTYASDCYIYENEPKAFLDFKELECQIEAKSVSERVDYLQKLSQMTSKNRFACKATTKPKRWFK